MLSILIPTYNHPVINLVSALYQQCQEINIPFEILVLDDNSSNKNIKKKNKEIEAFPFCKYIEHTKNKGRAISRNTLAKKANYTWLLFLDADVQPKGKDFIKKYVQHLNTGKANIFSGGIVYEESKPLQEKMLRWEYGRKREEKNAEFRNKIPFVIVTGNLLIKKDIFQKINTIQQNLYGEDLVLSQHIKDRKINAIHIENPVVHLGLETSEHFFKKSLQMVENLVIFENKQQLKNDFTKLQRSYLKLKKFYLTSAFSFIVSKMKGKMEQNFLSANPNLFWFDLYRLHHYIQFKKNKNA